MTRRSITTVVAVAASAALLASTFAVATAAGNSSRDMPKGAVTCSALQPSNSPFGKPTHLEPGVTYTPSAFPIPIQLSVPDRTWSGGQWKTGSTGCRTDRFGLGQAPFYGWIDVGHGGDIGQHRGSIVIMTSYSHTPSVGAVIGVMQKSQTGVAFEPPVTTRLGGLVGKQLDGHVEAVRHQFFAFTKPGAAAGAHADGFDLAHGAQLRIVVLDAHGRTIVVYIATGASSAADFTSFLAGADRVLKTVRFPRG